MPGKKPGKSVVFQLIQVAPPGGQIFKHYKWCHLVIKFPANAITAKEVKKSQRSYKIQRSYNSQRSYKSQGSYKSQRSYRSQRSYSSHRSENSQKSEISLKSDLKR